MTQYLLVGNGRLALHFREYFRHLRLSFTTWSRKENSAAELNTLIANADRVLLLISDSSLQEFAEKNRDKKKKTTWIHFSGALEVPGIESFHPLMTFGPEAYDLAAYNRIPFVTTSSLSLEEALPGLSNPCYSISSEKKARYHALCVLSGNFSTILWQKFIGELEAWNLPGHLPYEYAKQSVENVFAHPATALTGPFARKDLLTQEKNLKALGDDPFADVYRSFQKAFNSRGSQ